MASRVLMYARKFYGCPPVRSSLPATKRKLSVAMSKIECQIYTEVKAYFSISELKCSSTVVVRVSDTCIWLADGPEGEHWKYCNRENKPPHSFMIGRGSRPGISTSSHDDAEQICLDGVDDLAAAIEQQLRHITAFRTPQLILLSSDR
nr:hypothetical protein CFP56_07556 [Quercus suber]